MGQMLERGDTNKDGALDKAELKKVRCSILPYHETRLIFIRSQPVR